MVGGKSKCDELFEVVQCRGLDVDLFDGVC